MASWLPTESAPWHGTLLLLEKELVADLSNKRTVRCLRHYAAQYHDPKIDLLGLQNACRRHIRLIIENPIFGERGKALEIACSKLPGSLKNWLESIRFEAQEVPKVERELSMRIEFLQKK